MARRVFNGSDLINTGAVQDHAVEQNMAPVQNEGPVQPVSQQVQAPVQETVAQSAGASRRGARRAAMEGTGAAPAPFRAASSISQRSFQPAAAPERVIPTPPPVPRETVIARAEPPVMAQEENNPYAHMFASWDLLPPMMVIRRVKRK